MNLKTHHNWWQGLLCLLVSLSFGQTGHAQVNYLSLFGTTNNCLTGSPHNRLSCNSIPGMISTSGKADITDSWAALNGGVGRDNLKNATYDKAGNLLFSVNENGVYAPDGTQRYTFAANLDSGDFYVYRHPDSAEWITPGRAVSEIVTFPVPGTCYQYYSMFWAEDIEASRYVLRAIKVVIDKDTYPASSSITCASHVVLDSFSEKGYYWKGSGLGDESFTKRLITADAPNIDGSRYIYTLQRADSGASKMRRWKIGADGSLPNVAYTYYNYRPSGSGKYQTNAYGDKSKILTVHGRKYFTYITGRTGSELSGGATAGPFFGCYLNMYTLDSATSIYSSSLSTSLLPNIYRFGLDWANMQITGFEYVPDKDVIYFTYIDMTVPSLPAVGGIGYWTFSGDTIFSSNSTVEYRFSDLELTKKGDLLMVSGNDATFTEGHLAYLNVSDPGFTPSAVITPTVVTTSCSSFLYVPVLNTMQIGIVGTGGALTDIYYLGNQIRGEDYSSWGPDISSVYTVTGTEVWTPTSNPVATASGVTTSSISCRGIVIKPGGSLTIQGMTVKMTENSFIDVLASTSAAAGGRLFLDNATLTSNTGGCDNPTWSM